MFFFRLFFQVSLQFPLISSENYLPWHIIFIFFPLPFLARSKAQMILILSVHFDSLAGSPVYSDHSPKKCNT